MNKYKATKNLTLKTPGIYVAEGEVVELEPTYAEQVNNDLKSTFPNVDAVLELVEETKPVSRSKKAETKASEDATE
ncbi:TPA: hypothetical protein ACIRIH_001329 [Streptococcus suis]|uniref:hypothetical protein n=1 Tax=Streptococcus suis TaxID=1307 RepID=UPI001616B777|nr:hypothetical protein [Streptococcus suis]BCK44619.1 hypothetical protein DAT300_01580 [Streptococcus suis]HEL1741101.1 hypothetical protein [Streptococcus suis]HEL2353157.1 hypothetical protein [Streptococcus suis]HEL9638192.1 hypothetical protein [Streptococcus suis]HEM3871656.1 hypothetical protein [Streptococcus suis]